MLEQSITLLHYLQDLQDLHRRDLAAPLERALGGAPLEKPADHTGDASTDMLRIDLDLATRHAIVESMRRAVDDGLTTPATRERGLGGFVEAWDEYARYNAVQR